MTRRPMALEHELERLLTLSRADIDRAVNRPAVRAELVEFCVDEEIELREEADSARARGDEDHAAACEQEASAWRHTARVLRSDAIVTDHASRRSA